MDRGLYRSGAQRGETGRSAGALQPDLIISSTTPITAALQQQTRTIPIIFPALSDPVGSGFVASFSRPGGNITGFNVSEPTQTGKWVELLREIAPHVARVAMLFNAASAPYAEYWLNPFKDAAASLAVEAISAPIRDESELDSVIAAQAYQPNSGLIAMPDSFTIAYRLEIISLADHYRLPAIYPFRFFAEVGGLLSYGVDLVDNYRRVATYVDRILKGEKPSELPIQTPVKFEQDCQGARPYGATGATRPRRRGDRVTPRNVAYWPIASFRVRATIRSLLERSGHQLGGQRVPFRRE